MTRAPPDFDKAASPVTSEALLEALEDAFDLQALKEAREKVAIAIATGAQNLLEVNVMRRDGRETSAIQVTTFKERMAFLEVCKTIIDRAEGRAAASNGIKTDFSRVPVDP